MLETLCESKAAGVTELSNQLGIKPSSMHRFLTVLSKLGYVPKKCKFRQVLCIAEDISAGRQRSQQAQPDLKSIKYQGAQTQ